jgi:uncharacterized membrane protein
MRIPSPPESTNGSISNWALAAATCAAAATLIPVVAHQVGAIDHLPDPPGSVFASDRITKSKSAYPLGIPDGILGLASYGATLGLVVLAAANPKTRKLLAVKLLGDGSLAAFNVVRQLVSFRRLCSWCTATAVCTAAMLIAGREIIASELEAGKAWR